MRLQRQNTIRGSRKGSETGAAALIAPESMGTAQNHQEMREKPGNPGLKIKKCASSQMCLQMFIPSFSKNPTKMKARVLFESINPKTGRLEQETILDKRF